MKNLIKNIPSLPKSIMAFLKSVVAEMKKTEFPTRSKSFKLAGTVITSAVVLTLVLFLLDSLFVLGRTYLTSLNQ